MGKHHKHKNRKKAKASQKPERKTENQQVAGMLTVTPGGFGFVTPHESAPDIFIPPRFLGTAMHGDEVAVEILKERPWDRDSGKGPAGKIVEIITQTRRTLVGELIAGRKVRPLSRKLPFDIQISGSLLGAKRGEWVEVNLLDRAEHNDHAIGEVVSVLGQVGHIKSDLDAVAKEYDLAEPYTPAQEEAAAELLPEEIERIDLTGRFCVTIDPHDAKDFDDSVSYRPTDDPGVVELGVHIADVAAWIRPRSDLDREAEYRGFTAYLPGRTLPMLPKALTHLISLTPHRESKAHTVLMKVHLNTGKILESKRMHSTIQVKARLSFDKVQEFLHGNTPEGWPEELCKNIGLLAELAKSMRQYRKKTEHFLELATTEIRVLVDEERQEILGIERRLQSDADKLVEEFMLAANSEVAKELIESHTPGLFRVHPQPDPEKIEEFTAFVVQTFNMYPGDMSSRMACNRFLKSLPDDHRKPVIIGALLRSLPRATYSETCSIHFGLGKGRYSHFTSPIRRYPDLLVHQQLWAQETKGRLLNEKQMEKLALACTQKEIKNDEAFYEANDRMKLQYLEKELDVDDPVVHEGIISKIVSSGMVIDIPELGIGGFVPVESLAGSFKYKKKSKKLRAKQGKQKYQCGDFIYVRLERLDFIRGSAIFEPVNY